jgi:hypothetical protein
MIKRIAVITIFSFLTLGLPWSGQAAYVSSELDSNPSTRLQSLPMGSLRMSPHEHQSEVPRALSVEHHYLAHNSAFSEGREEEQLELALALPQRALQKGTPGDMTSYVLNVADGVLDRATYKPQFTPYIKDISTLAGEIRRHQEALEVSNTHSNPRMSSASGDGMHLLGKGVITTLVTALMMVLPVPLNKEDSDKGFFEEGMDGAIVNRARFNKIQQESPYQRHRNLLNSGAATYSFPLREEDLPEDPPSYWNGEGIALAGDGMDQQGPAPGTIEAFLRTKLIQLSENGPNILSFPPERFQGRGTEGLSLETLNALYRLAERHHQGQMRDDDGQSSYLAHILSSVSFLLELGVTNREVIAATFLHDTIEASILNHMDRVGDKAHEITDPGKKQDIGQRIEQNILVELENTGLDLQKVLSVLYAMIREEGLDYVQDYLSSMVEQDPDALLIKAAETIEMLFLIQFIDSPDEAEFFIFGRPEGHPGTLRTFLEMPISEQGPFINHLPKNIQTRFRGAIVQALLNNYNQPGNSLRNKPVDFFENAMRRIDPTFLIEQDTGIENMLETAKRDLEQRITEGDGLTAALSSTPEADQIVTYVQSEMGTVTPVSVQPIAGQETAVLAQPFVYAVRGMPIQSLEGALAVELVDDESVDPRIKGGVLKLAPNFWQTEGKVDLKKVSGSVKRFTPWSLGLFIQASPLVRVINADIEVPIFERYLVHEIGQFLQSTVSRYDLKPVHQDVLRAIFKTYASQV